MIKLLILIGIILALFGFFNKPKNGQDDGRIDSPKTDDGSADVEDAVWEDVK